MEEGPIVNINHNHYCDRLYVNISKEQTTLQLTTRSVSGPWEAL